MDPSRHHLAVKDREFLASVALAALHRPSRPPLLARLRVAADVDAYLPAVPPPLTDRSGHAADGRSSMGKSWAGHGQPAPLSSPAKEPTCCSRPSRAGADDGIRTRDPHLGKVTGTVRRVVPSALTWSPVRDSVRLARPVQAVRSARYQDISSSVPPPPPDEPIASLLCRGVRSSSNPR